MKLLTSLHNATIEANWNAGDIAKVDLVVKYMVENLGYKIIEGSDDPEEYYVILFHNSTIEEAKEDYKIAKNATK